MRWRSSQRAFSQWLLFLVLLYIQGAACTLGDPYKLLGVGRSATLQEIRRAYKQLAKEWHPDKTDNPAAESKFVEIKQAYEILSDPERRKLFDKHGITDEDNASQRPDYSYYGRFTTDPLDELFGTHGGGRFHFQDHDITVFHKMSVTTRQFENSLIPKSLHTPHLVLFYTDWCFPCLQVTPLWRKLVDTLEPLGVSLATLHAGREAALARKVGVTTLPSLVLLLDGKYFVYKEHLNGVQKIIEFIRSKLPYKMVPVVTDATVDVFLSGWHDNRVRGLIFEKQTNLRLRYLITAFHFRDRVAFGYVQPSEDTVHLVRQKFKVTASDNMDTVLLFNENSQRPIASVSMADIPSTTLHHVITTNQYLALPRLSSQEVLEALCPAEWNRPRKRLCAVLVTGNTADHDGARSAFRQFALDSPWSVERVRFVYLYHEKQTEFVQALSTDGIPDQPLLRIVIIWRRDTSHIKYEWLEAEWRPNDESTTATTDATTNNNNNNINDTKLRLQETIGRLLKSTEALSYEAIVKDLLDEHAQGVFSRIVTKLFITADIVYESITKDQLLPALSIIATIGFIIAAGYFMAYLVRLEEESIQQQRYAKRNGNNNNEPTPSPDSPTNGGVRGLHNLQQPPRELYLHELRAEKYNGLVRLLKPGCRTIVLFVDLQSRLQLIPAFHKIIWPYRNCSFARAKLCCLTCSEVRRNKTLMFAHMSLERGLSWYRDLLQLSLPEPRELNINPRNCVGTVLALNGHRKYFCMFHAKHSESKSTKKNKNKTAKTLDDPELGAFIGFESDTSSDEDEEVLLQGTLLDGLPNWLDRLFEGSTRRYYINYWPDFPTK